MINLSMNQRITILFFTLLRTISQVLEHIESHHKHTQSLIFYSAPWNFKVCFSEAMTKSKLVSLNEKLNVSKRRLELLEVQVGNASTNPSVFATLE